MSRVVSEICTAVLTWIYLWAAWLPAAHQHILAPWSDGSLGSVCMHNASLANFWLVYRFQGYWQDASQAFS